MSWWLRLVTKEKPVEIDFDKAFERLIGHEGKFQNKHSDRGNWTTGVVGEGTLKGTKFGISAMSYPHLDIERLTLEEAKEIYRRDYWNRAGANQYHPALGYQVFDAAVNHGIENAVRFLQRAVDVADDGDVGPKTLKAIHEETLNDAVIKFLAERLTFFSKLSTWDDYGRGWARRVALNMKYGAIDTPE